MVNKNLISLHIGPDEYRLEQKTLSAYDEYVVYKNDAFYRVFTNICEAARYLVDKWEEVQHAIL